MLISGFSSHLCFGKQFSWFQIKFLSKLFSLSQNVWPKLKSIENLILNSFSIQVLTYHFAEQR